MTCGKETLEFRENTIQKQMRESWGQSRKSGCRLFQILTGITALGTELGAYVLFRDGIWIRQMINKWCKR